MRSLTNLAPHGAGQVVQENVDEFEMEPEEAIADAVQQFENQGVNLSNIIRRAPGASPDEDPTVVREVRNLWQFFRDRRPESYGSLTEQR